MQSGSHIINTYARLPVSFHKGEGCWLWDVDGNKYLDALSGIAVCGLGHAHPKVVEAIRQQAGRLIHTSNLYGIPEQERLAAELSKVSGMEEFFFCNSGAEANEAAIKIARRYGHDSGVENPSIIVMDGSFHGRTLATISATGNRKVQAGFEPLVQGFIRVPYDDVDAIQLVADNRQDVVAILVEPVQGEGGINIPAVDYLSQLRNICGEHGWLLMLDEIQTGMGRSGAWFAHQLTDQIATAIPDVMTLAKGLGNGVPIGACGVAGRAVGVLQPGNHGSTFGGNFLVCAAALATIEVIESEDLANRAGVLGKRLTDGFAAQLSNIAGVRQIRSKGLLIGIELEEDCPDLVLMALEQGLLINVANGKVIRLLPPLIMSDEEGDELVTRLSQLLIAYLG